MINAPIALFVYNRPSHTRLTVESLLKNALSKDSDLYIYSDAAKSDMQVQAVNDVRQYIHQIEGFKSVIIIERETNFGLARSIIDGVTRLCEEYGRAIVLEDDLVTTPYFLQFMNDALEFYKDHEKVMHISGSTYPVEFARADSTYFLRVPLCWGWATWARAWRDFDNDVAIMKRFDRRMIAEFDLGGTYHFWAQLQLNRSGKLNTWFIFWYATLFLKGGFALFPCKSLVMNIGMDGTGTNCDINKDFETVLINTPVVLSNIPVVESPVALEQHKLYFRRTYPPYYLRAIRKAARICKGLTQ